MSEKKAKQALDRRGFMKVVSLGSAAAAASVAPGLVTPAEAYDPGKEETKGRYRETDHVKAFYRTNGY
ncbi:MAG: twin-arginine translocation signal domain-containing protein [Bosea sp.]|nr:twin-arginine translocation signal domain-containing protein [Bosea sp. (in: a-proteobacteria)]